MTVSTSTADDNQTLLHNSIDISTKHNNHEITDDKELTQQRVYVTPRVVYSIESIGLHYGWFTLLVSGIFYFAAVPGMTFGIGFYNEYWMSSLKLSRTTVGTCWTVALITSSLAIPLCGYILDKYGARRAVLYSVIPYGILLVATAFVQGPITLTICMLGLRWFMALLELLAQWLTNNWFVKRKGVAMTITATIGASSLVYPNVLQLFSDWVGYQYSLICQAVLWSVIMLLLCPLIVDRPEYANRLPDAQWNTSGNNNNQHALKRNKSESNNNTVIEMQQLNSNDNNNDDIHNHNATTHNTDKHNIDNNIHNNTDDEIHWRFEDAIKTRMFITTSSATACIASFWVCQQYQSTMQRIHIRFLYY